MNKFLPKEEKAFTLVELLIVITVIGILAGVITIAMSGALERARIAKSQSFSSSVRNSLMANRVSEWKFNETSSITAIDSLGTSNGTLLSGVTRMSGKNCVSEGCLQFDGTGGYVTTEANANLRPATNMTIEVWADPSDTQNTYSDIMGGHQNQGWVIQQDGTNLNQYYFAYHNGVTFIGMSTTVKLASNTWNHLVIVKNNAGIIHYLNGKAVANFPSPDDIVYGPSFSISIGNGYSGTARCFRGKIDDVRIYNQSLAASDIKDHYLAGLDQLLAKGDITKEDYQQRLAELNDNESYAEK